VAGFRVEGNAIRQVWRLTRIVIPNRFSGEDLLLSFAEKKSRFLRDSVASE